MTARVLVVAGSDSGAGAGIQADLKTVMALGGYATTAITALTAQATMGVQAVVPVEPEFVARQMEVVLADIGADVIKTGMLYDADIVETVVRVHERRAASVPLVVDPVMIAKGGARLLGSAAIHALKRRLIPRAALLTPNLPECQVLTGMSVDSVDAMSPAADALLALGAAAVLIKGGHLPGDEIIDLLRTADGDEQLFVNSRLPVRSTHGTGCTLASAIATGIAEGLTLRDAVSRAETYLHRAIEWAPGLGRGSGPLEHAHPFRAGPATELS